MHGDQIEQVSRQLEAELPDWRVDCCLTFGSLARDEAVDGSDVDLWFIGHSANQIFLDKVWRQGRWATGLDEFLAAHRDCQVVDIDTWGELQKKLGVTLPLVFGSPLADTRWLLWQLAEEQDWQSFVFVATGKALVDPDGFLSALHGFLWSKRPFHVHPEHGIVATMKILCEREKLALLRDLALLSGENIIGPTAAHTVWLWPAVECIRDTVGLLTLIQQGKPLCRRQEVLSFVGQQFPQHLPVAERVYRYKATNEGRNELRELLASGPEVRQRELRPLTEGVISFWHTAMSEVDRCILQGCSKVQFATEDWRSRNHAAYDQFFAGYLAQISPIVR